MRCVRVDMWCVCEKGRFSFVLGRRPGAVPSKCRSLLFLHQAGRQRHFGSERERPLSGSTPSVHICIYAKEHICIEARKTPRCNSVVQNRRKYALSRQKTDTSMHIVIQDRRSYAHIMHSVVQNRRKYAHSHPKPTQLCT